MEIPQLSLEKVGGNPMCFGCGKENPHSLKLNFHEEGDGVKADFVPSECHQSWPGFVHGGVMMAVLDEAIGWASFIKNIYCVTAKIEVRLRTMGKIGEHLIVTARIDRQSKRTLDMSAEIKRPDGTIVAEASSVQFIVR